MDCKEEQQQELEILQSIYPDELKLLDETHYNIALRLETSSERTHILTLHVTYPDEYPEVVPELDIDVDIEEPELEYEEEDSDEEAQDNKPVIISELVEFYQSDIQEFIQKLNGEAEEQIGMPSVFALCSSLKDMAEQRFEDKCETMQKKHDEELLVKEREEQKKFYGTKVTKESYEEWRLNFRKEMGIDERIELRKKQYHKGKLTGKEIFEKGLAGDEDELDIKDLSIED
jgi:hypothetical protein